LLASLPVWATVPADKGFAIQIGNYTQTGQTIQTAEGLDYLPVRDALECYGATVVWAEEAETKLIVTFAEEKDQLIISEETQEISTADKAYPYMWEDGKIYLPIEFYQHIFNCDVQYDQEENVLLLDENKPPVDIAEKDWTNYIKLRNTEDYQKTENVTYTYYQEGKASWYGIEFQNRRTAGGEAYDVNKLTAAHRELPFGTMVRVTAEHSGKSVIVKINDRGPYHGNRILDLSQAAAQAIDLEGKGVGWVKIEIVEEKN